MKLTDARKLANQLMREHGLADWSFDFDRAVVRFGQCRHKDKAITLSAKLTQLNDFDKVNDTILHEIAHALVGTGNGHNRVWKAKCREIGANPARTYDGSETKLPSGKYIASCDNCNREWPMHRARRRISACAQCCNEFNNGRFDFKYQIRIRKVR